MFSVLRELTIRQKLIIIYISLILIPGSIFLYFYYERSSDIFVEEMNQTILQTLKQAEMNMTFKLNNIENISDVLITNSILQPYLSREPTSSNIGQQIDDYKELEKLVYSMENQEDVFKVRFFVHPDLIYSRDMINFFPLTHLQEKGWYEDFTEQKAGLFFSRTYQEQFIQKPDTQVISVALRVRHPHNYDEIVGVIVIDFAERVLYEVLDNIDLFDQQTLYVADQDGYIISYIDKEFIGQKITNDRQASLTESSTGYESVELGGIESNVIFTEIPLTNWRMVAEVPTEEIVRNNDALNRISGVILFVITVISFLLIIFLVFSFITDRFSRRIRDIIHGMKNEGLTEIDQHFPQGARGIYRFEQSITYLYNTIKNMFEHYFNAKLSEKDASLKALQAQINPHFLYNTLDTINWMAIRKRATDISYMIDALSKYFRLSLNKGRDIVSVEDEIDLINTYLNIQNVRYEDSIHTEWDIDENAFPYTMPKLTLQPIIENALIHGRKDKKVHLRIAVKVMDDYIYFAIEDQGMGIKEEVLKDIFKEKNHDTEKGGYGLYNVHQRIKLFAGEDKGIDITSKEGKGTKVIIRLLKRKQ